MSAPTLHRHPAWFGSVMGTAGLSIAFLQESAFIVGAPFVWIANALLLIASVLALVLLPRYVTRPRDREAFAHELSDPGHGAMLATFPAGLLVLAVAWARVGSEWLGSGIGLTVSAILVSAGALIAIGLSVVWASAQGRGDVDLAGVNGGWLIPPVMSLIVPLSIAPQMIAHPEQAAWLLAIGLGFYGVGAFLFLAILALLIARIALRPPIPHAMSPSLWIPLAPSGILGLALLRLMQAAAEVGLLPEEAVAVGIVVSAMGLGLGLWWSLFALGDLLRVRRSGGLPFHPGWWGFVFPIAAMQLSLAALGAVLGSTVVQVAGLLGFVVLLAVWLLVAARTTGAVIRHARSARPPA
jgi:C4-dicarboxylate transporter/malic acid transport protein